VRDGKKNTQRNIISVVGRNFGIYINKRNNMKKNWVYYMQEGLKSMWKKKEYPYNIEFGDGRTKEEMDKMQDELMQSFKDKED
jgi:hypothetical protein